MAYPFWVSQVEVAVLTAPTVRYLSLLDSSVHLWVIAFLLGYTSLKTRPSGYDKRTMATDMQQLMQHLGYSKVAMVGHDRGARVATRFAKDFPEATDRLVVVDNIPTRVIFDSMNAEIARGHWFFIFNQLPDLPEALIHGNEEIWLRHFFTTWSYNPQMMSDEEVAVYVKAYKQPGAVRGAMLDYRAGKEDVAQDKEDQEKLIDCPILAIWGEDFELVAKMFDVMKIWQSMAHHVQGVSIPQCGHLPQEEQPDAVNKALLEFLSDWNG